MTSKDLTDPTFDEGDESQALRPLSHEIYERLVTELISLRLPPKARLSVDSLARHFNVSQTPVRAALIRLEAEGLVIRKHNTGFRAAPLPTSKQFREIYLMRALIEPEAASLAAGNARLSDVEELRSMYEKMQQLAAADTEGNYGRFAVLDGQFHAHIAVVSNNELIKHVLKMLHSHMHLFRLNYHESVANSAIEEHLCILRAIERRDPDGARTAMASHISASCKRMEPHYSTLGT